MYYSFLKNFVLAAFFTFSASIMWAQTKNSGRPSWNLGLSLINHNSGSTATSATSTSKPLFADIYNQITLLGFYNLNPNWTISPLFSMSLLGKKSPEGNQKYSLTILGGRFSRDINSNFDFHLGSGLLVYRIDSNSGTITLDNGNSTTAFGTPSESKSSSLIYYDIGINYTYQKYKIEFSTFLTQPFEANKFAYNPALTLTMEIY